MSQATRLDIPSQSARAIRLEPRPGAAAQSALPQALSARLAVEQQFPTAGAEADVFLVRERQSQELRVLKLYRQGLKPKVEVLERVSRAGGGHLIRVYEHGQAGGSWFELLEYARYGSMRTLMETRLDADAGAALALGVVRELSLALAHLHAQKVVHRDVKPENVLVRTLEPLDLVLTDFGISSVIEATQKFTGVARTLRYSAPEAASGAIGEAVDWWSLGMVVLELVSGRHPYEGLSEAVMLRQQMTKDVDASGVADARLRRLCEGLLQRDPDRRWGAEHVARWLKTEAGEAAALTAFSASADADARLARNAHALKAARPFVFLGGEYVAVQPLAIALWSRWRAAIEELASGRLLAWVRDDLREQSVASLLLDWEEIDAAARRQSSRLRGRTGFVDPAVASTEERLFALLQAGGAPVAALNDPPDDNLLTCAVHARRARRGDAESLAWIEAHLFAPGSAGDVDARAQAVALPATLAQYRAAVAVHAEQAARVHASLEPGVGFRVADQAALLALIALAALGHDARPLTGADSRAEIEAFSRRLDGRLAPLLAAEVPHWMREELWAQARPLILNTLKSVRSSEAHLLESKVLKPLRALEAALSRGELDGEARLAERIGQALPKRNPRPESSAAKEAYKLAQSARGLDSRAGTQAFATAGIFACWGFAMWGLWRISAYYGPERMEDPVLYMLPLAILVTLVAVLAWFGERRARLRAATRTHARALAAALRDWIAELELEIS